MRAFPRAARLGCLLACLAASSACRTSSEPRERTAPSAPSARAATSAVTSAAPSPRPAPIGCRVLGVKGPADGSPKVGEAFRGGAWIELAAGVELSLKHGETTREFALVGPGRFLVCPAGEEAVMVARGSLRTTPGPGSRAGAEVLIGTPFAALHYADARLTLSVEASKLRLGVEQGGVAVSAAANVESGKSKPLGGADAGSAASERSVVAPGGKLELAGAVDAEALARRCVEASPSRASAPEPAASAGTALGEWAVEKQKARRTARFVCARARAAVGRLEGAEFTRLSGLIDGS